MTLIFSALLSVLAVWVGLPALVDLVSWLRALRLGSHRTAGTLSTPPRLLFVVPAHNEELLIARTVSSLASQRREYDNMAIVVVADNCTDETAGVAEASGARVLVRNRPDNAGKGHAIRWAFENLRAEPFDAMVIIDADSIVDVNFASELSREPAIRNIAIQAFDGLSNERENWLTRLAGLLTRMRYEIALPIKARSGLNCPLTGNGIVIGRDLLDRFGWSPKTITEGWELYADYTMKGVQCRYCSTARAYAQETKSLKQSRSQRMRWTTGRHEVLRRTLPAILRSRELAVLQKCDLIAELSSAGPVVRASLGAIIYLAAGGLPGPLELPVRVLAASGVAQPVLYMTLCLRNHPEPFETVKAIVHLPWYVVWRLGVAVQAVTGRKSRAWARTERHVTD